MAADLSSILPTPSGAALSSSFRGLYLPSLVNGSFVPVPIDDLVSTNPWGDGYNPNYRGFTLSGTKAAMQELVDLHNNALDFILACQKLNSVLHCVSRGLYGISWQNYINSSERWYGDFVSLGEWTTLQSTEFNPLSMAYSVITENPEWPAPDTPRLLTTVYHNVLPANGLMYIAGGSILAGRHGGWIYDAVSIADDHELGDTFQVHMLTPTGSGMLVELPDNIMPVSCVLEYYIGGNREPWHHVRKIMPFYGVEATKQFALPHVSQKFQLETSVDVFMTHNVNTGLFSCIATNTTSGATANYSGHALDRLNVATINAAHVDMSDIDFTGYDQIDITYYKESAASEAILCGQAVAAQWIADYSESNPYGTANSYDGGTLYYDSNPDTPCRSDGKPLTKAQVDRSPTEITNQIAWKQLVVEFPWKMLQTLEGYAQFKPYRIGTPSLACLNNAWLETPVGYHPIVSHLEWMGGFGKVRQDDNSLNYEGNGLQQEWTKPITAGATDGVVGTRYNDFGSSDTADFNTETMLMAGDADYVPYDCTVTGTIGKAQRCGDRRYDIVAYGITPVDYTSQSFQSGTMFYGYWDSNRLPCAPEDAVYYWHFDIDANYSPYNPQEGGAFGGTKFATKIYSASWDSGNNQWVLNLKHRAITAGSITSSMEETTTEWLGPGTNVPLPDNFRINNYKNPYNSRGPQRSLIHIGDGIQLGSQFPESVRNMKFMVVAASPASGASQTIIPDSDPILVTHPTYAFRVGYGNSEERMTSVTVKRNGNSVDLVGYDNEDGRMPFEIDKDVFIYQEGWDEDATYYGIFFKFSALNVTGSDADREVNIVVDTDLGGHYESSLDLYDDVVWGADVWYKHEISTDTAFTGTGSVIAYSLGEDGDIDATTLTRRTTSTTNFAQIGVNEYYVQTIDADTIKIWLPYQRTGQVFLIRADQTGEFSGTDAQYFSQKVLMHAASFPAYAWGEDEDYEDWVPLSDVAVLQDENGALADLTELDVENFDITVVDNCVAAPNSSTHPLSLMLDDTTQTEGTDYTWFGADGKIWGKAPITATALYARAYLANRVSEIKSEDFTAVREICEAMLGRHWFVFGGWEGMPGHYAEGRHAWSWVQQLVYDDPEDLTVITEGTPGLNDELPVDEDYQGFADASFTLISPGAPYPYWSRNLILQIVRSPRRSDRLDRTFVLANEVTGGQIGVKIDGLISSETQHYYGWKDEFVAAYPDQAGTFFTIVNEEAPSSREYGVGTISETTEETTASLGVAAFGITKIDNEMKAVPLGAIAITAPVADGEWHNMDASNLVEDYLTYRTQFAGIELIPLPSGISADEDGLTEAKFADLYKAYASEDLSWTIVNGVTEDSKQPFGTVTTRRLEWSSMSFRAGYFSCEPSCSFASRGLQHAEITALADE